MWANKNILIGICGSIAAYKIPYLVRMFVKAGANVKVITSADALHFVSSLSLATLSKNEVHTTLFNTETNTWNQHVAIALSADLFIVAPATANTLAKMAHGICDNILLATYLSAKCPLFIAPAMDLDMWKHPSTKANINTLKSFPKHTIIPPQKGELASGLIGEGRMAEPEEIFKFISDFQTNQNKYAALNVLVSAGPTYEAIDPVRFIGNHSSGKMGYAIAQYWQSLGANVTLISGPTALECPNGVNRINVQSASDMLAACLTHFKKANITIMSAAVADYTPENISLQKIKKSDEQFLLPLKKTSDILEHLGSIKKKNQILVGFALETENEVQNAEKKLKRKNLNAIVLNSLNDTEAGFKKDTNKISIIDENLKTVHFPTKTKTEVAADICQFILNTIQK